MSSYNSSNNQPTFNPYVNGGGLGTPSNGFASRGKGNHIKRLSVAPPANINSIHEDEIDSNPAPRTSRSHLLAGLRTAPRSSNGVPASAPYNQQQFGLDASQYASRNNSNGFRASQNMPQTAAAPNFSGLAYNPYANGYGQQKHMFAYADQILAPPSFAEEGDDSVDPQVYAELMATNMRLMQRQQQLQEQLRNVTAAAQQFQGLNIAGQQQQQQQQHQQQHQQQQQQQYHNHPLSPSTSYYSQQMQNGLQPIVTPVPNQPGVLSVYNPMTGQQNFILDPSYQELSASPPASTPGLVNSSPDSEGPAIYRRDNMSPPSAAANNHNRRNMFSPPAKSPSPPRGEVEPLPQPSANAFRPGHRKALSVAQSNGRDSSRLNGPKSAGFPATPMTGTFGPGMARAGEHPVRQPRGPPPLEELVAKPTTKHEGSKNFATRQRRRAVFNLVKAGHERRTGRSGSADASSPASDAENGILANSDADVESNGSLSGHSSTGSLRSVATGAIGSEIKKRREERRSNAGSFSSEDGTSNEERKRSGLFALTSQAEKRKSAF